MGSCRIEVMENAGEVNPGAAEDFRESATRQRMRVLGVIRVLGVTKRVLWWVGFVLFLPVTWGWYSELPIQFFLKFPYPVDYESRIWLNRIIASTVGGLGCWFLVGLISLVVSFIRTSPVVRSLKEKVLKVVVAVVTFLILVTAGGRLRLLSIVFGSYDATGIPQ
jgi:hypothetical protein